MPNHIFPTFFNEKRELRQDVLNRLNFNSKIGIEGFSCEELTFIYEKFSLEFTPVNVHHAEWGEKEKINTFYNFNDTCNFISEIFYEDKILFFSKVNLYVWEGGRNKFYVLFGENKIIREANFPFLEKEYYMEILNEDTGLSEKWHKYMLDALEKYGGFNYRFTD